MKFPPIDIALYIQSLQRCEVRTTAERDIEINVNGIRILQIISSLINLLAIKE